MLNIAVLVSGGGTNLQALLDSEARGENPNGKITLVVASKPGVFALERAAKDGVEGCVVRRKDYATSEEFDAALGDGSKADTVRKAFIKLRGELTHLYQMQCSLRTAAQSDGETALVDDLLADLEKISRKAHEQTHFTYTTLEEIAALN